MIAPARTERTHRSQQHTSIEQQHQDQFLGMLPRIKFQARRAFRSLGSELKEELIQEVIANAFCAFADLVRRGKADIAFASPLASFAIKQVLRGRRIGIKTNQFDLTSPYARAASGIVVERLDRFDNLHGEWREVFVEDRHATPADVAAARIDVADWLRSLSARDRRIAEILAIGESTSEVAQRFKVSWARISQLRGMFRRSWEQFQGENGYASQVAAA